MDIIWYGHSCFRLTERGRITVVTDPYSDELGLPPLKLKGDVVTISHRAPGHSHVDAVKGVNYVVISAGEYEIGNVFITGIPLHDLSGENPRPNVAYLIEYDSLRVLHVGDLAFVPDQSVVEDLGEVHVLLLPVGGGCGLKGTQAAEVVALVEPSYVVPMHYALPDLRIELEPIDRFLKAMGVSHPQQEETLRVNLSTLPEQTQIVILTPQI